MKEAQFVAPVIREYLEGKNRDEANPFADYQIHVENGIDVLEDTLDGFWEHPFAFAILVYGGYFDKIVDVFAGRIYNNQPSDAVMSFRQLLKRERTYDSEDIYSMPICSRFHPERAPIWVVALVTNLMTLPLLNLFSRSQAPVAVPAKKGA